jgi:predicted TIM-barrel fold metal-dependent hydrolase
MLEKPTPRYVLISADAHAGADMYGYKPYLTPSLHDQFEAWASSFHDPWADFDAAIVDEDPDLRMGRTSFVSAYSWESDTRIEHMDREGIAAEVVFPNTVPPFYPSGAISAPAPRSAAEYQLRWAGVQAHNRWLADFCAEAPGRRAGLAQIFLDDIDAAVSEVRWAREAGLGGVLLPTDHLSHLVRIYEERLDPLWAACEDLALPVHRHALTVAEPEVEFGPAATAIGAHEVEFFFYRGLTQLVFGGVFERFPGLKAVFTETGCSWVPGELRKMDFEISAGKNPEHPAHTVFGKAVESFSLSATEYFRRNCWLGASLLRPDEIELRHNVGVDRIMWGSDYPHTEGSFPNTHLALRALFADVPEKEVRAMTSLNAAEVYGFDLVRLQALADTIGPSVDELRVPVSLDELPTKTMSLTLGAAAGRLLAKEMTER